MLKSKRPLPSYPDGIVEIRRDSRLSSTFGARLNSFDLAEMPLVCTMAYSLASMRDQDLELAQRLNFTLTLKIKCQRFEDVATDCVAVVENALYSIAHIDYSRREMFIYLEGGTPLERA